MAARTPNTSAGAHIGLPFPSGSSSLGSYNMLSSPVSRKAPALASGDHMSASISALLQWFSRRPLLALVVFILCLLFCSVLVPVIMLDAFSSSFVPAGPTGPNQMFARSRSGALKHDLRAALGIGAQGGQEVQLAQLAEHNEAYARLTRERGEEPTELIASRAQELVQRAAEFDRRRAQHLQQQQQAGGEAAQQQAKEQEEARRRQMDQAAGVAADAAAPKSTLDPSLPPGMDNVDRSDNRQPERAQAVIRAFKHAYMGYERACFGQDDLHPLSKRCSNWVNAGLTIVDSLSTMMLMNGEGALEGEISRARNWVATSLHFRQPGAISFFETVIRLLGGLISAYDLSGDDVYLAKARELGDKLMPAFNTPSGHPRGQINLASGTAHDTSWTGGSALLAEVGTCQMEFAALSQRTGDPKFRIAAQKPIDALDKLNVPDGLYPIYININTGQFSNQKITFGAMGDSFYEYLLKMWLLTGRKDAQLQRMYLASMSGMLRKLYTHTGAGNGDHWFLADIMGGTKDLKMDHLVCFVPGMLALGVSEGIVTGEDAKQHLDAARQLMKTCFDSYDMQASKIGPEYIVFRPGLQPGDASYKLRPEMVESLFLLYRLTHDDMYRQWGWQTFEAIERHCRMVDGGYAALLDVRNPAAGKEDRMESFFLAETLKYLYLLFEGDAKLAISGKKQPGEFWVFNTEAHPIKSWA